MTASAILVLMLALVAGVVAAMQWINGRRAKSVMWGLIVLYWVILTVKNLCDLFL